MCSGETLKSILRALRTGGALSLQRNLTCDFLPQIATAAGGGRRGGGGEEGGGGRGRGGGTRG